MTDAIEVRRYDIPLDELDEAARIFVRHTNEALKEMSQMQLDPGASIQAVVQMSMRLYADFQGDDLETIRQIRKFLDGWERDVHLVGADSIH